MTTPSNTPSTGQAASANAPAQPMTAGAAVDAAGLDIPSTQEERGYAVVAHLSSLLGFMFIGPLIVYGVKGRQSPYVRFHCGQALAVHLASLVIPAFLMVAYIAWIFVVAGIGHATKSEAVMAGVAIGGVALAVLIGLLPLLLLVIGTLRGYRGSLRPLPFVGGLARVIQRPLFGIVDGIAGSIGGKRGQAGPPPGGGAGPV